MRIADIIENDYTNGEGVCVSVWVQGCPWHCKGCHNPESWDFNGGRLEKPNEREEILNLINKNGIQRNLSILGGEPMCAENIDFTTKLLAAAKEKYPTIKTFVWTGYVLDDIYPYYLKDIDVLIDGPFDLSLRDITLKLRGSSNQKIRYRGKDF